MPYSGCEKDSRIRDRQPLPLELTLVVPTLNVRGNLDSLLAGIEKAMGGLRWELIFVDDASEIVQQEPDYGEPASDKLSLGTRLAILITLALAAWAACLAVYLL